MKSSRRILLICCCFLVAAPFVFSQGISPFQHNRLLGMGNVSAAHSGLPASSLQPAALGDVDHWSVGLSGTQYFWLPEVRTGNIQTAVPTKAGTFGLYAQYYGFEAYNETSIGLAYARNLSEKLSIGARFIYLHTRIPETGSGGLVTFDLGVIYQLNKDWSFGMSLYNPAQQEKVTDEFLPTTLKLGVAKHFGKQATLSGEVEKTLAYEFRARLGLEYLPVEQLRILVGVQSHPATFSLGLGWQSKSGIALDLIQEYHIILGISPGLSLTYQPTKE